MQTAFSSLTRAFKSMTTPAMLKITAMALIINAVAIGAVIFGLFILLQSISIVSIGWLDALLDKGIMVFAVWLSSFVYPLLLPLIVSLFDTAIANRIEEHEYPNIPLPQPPFWPTLLDDGRFVLKVLIINLVMLPLYFIPLFIFLYYIVNGYLLGREFFDIIAGRHITKEDGRRLRARYAGTIIMLGAMITLASTLPILNLIAPILGVAAMVHLFHGMNPPYARHNIAGSGQIIEG